MKHHSAYRNQFENYGKMDTNMVLGRMKQWHYPLNFHGSGENLRSTYKRTNEDLEKKKVQNMSSTFTD